VNNLDKLILERWPSGRRSTLEKRCGF